MPLRPPSASLWRTNKFNEKHENWKSLPNPHQRHTRPDPWRQNSEWSYRVTSSFHVFRSWTPEAEWSRQTMESFPFSQTMLGCSDHYCISALSFPTDIQRTCALFMLFRVGECGLFVLVVSAFADDDTLFYKTFSLFFTFRFRFGFRDTAEYRGIIINTMIS